MSDNTELTVPSRPIEPRESPLADLRANALSVPVESMRFALDEYKDRRQAFRHWLLSQLVEGVHFGFPPGTQPRFDEHGNTITKQKKKGRDGSDEWVTVVTSPKQWKVKQSLYKAGADFICDLMGARDEYSADIDGWKQAGAVSGMFVYACYLKSRTTGEVLGEGRGAFKTGTKGMYENSAIKMCKKSAKCDAVINTYGLSDLFTQDLEDLAPPPETHENPPADETVPTASPRGKRVTKEQYQAVGKSWNQVFGSELPEGERLGAWKKWVVAICGRDFQAGAVAEWTTDDLAKVKAALPPDDDDGRYGE